MLQRQSLPKRGLFAMLLSTCFKLNNPRYDASPDGNKAAFFLPRYIIMTFSKNGGSINLYIHLLF